MNVLIMIMIKVVNTFFNIFTNNLPCADYSDEFGHLFRTIPATLEHAINTLRRWIFDLVRDTVPQKLLRRHPWQKGDYLCAKSKKNWGYILISVLS
jgi:hypothetical protein